MFKINIISQSANYSAEQVIAEYSRLLLSKKWYGWRCGFNIVQNQENKNIFTISGEKARLLKKAFEFVSIPLPCDVKIENQEKIENWAAKFDILLEVADFSIMEDETHNNCGDAFHALKMTAKRDNALILTVKCQEVIEQITTTQMVDFEQYTNIYQGLHSAVCGQTFRGIKPQKDKIGKVCNFFNDHFYTFPYDFRTEQGNKCRIKPQTYFNHNDLEFSGYIESFFAIMQELYKAEHPHGLEINNIINNKIYNFMSNKNFICRLFGKNTLPTIRLAVIAFSDQGKTFLLQDIIKSLREMGETSDGYQPQEPNSYYQDGQDKYGRIATFSWEGHKAVIGQTERYVARQNTHHQSCMNGGDNTQAKNCFKNFNFEFMDIPGEIFKADSLTKFRAVENTINSTKVNGFVVETWVKDGEEKLLVRYNKNISTTYSGEANKQVRYLSFSEYVATLNGYTKNGEDKNISGKELWNRFYEFETDTAITAMYEYLATKSLDVFADNNDKETFLNDFYFFYFCYTATDVIICDRINQTNEGQNNLLEVLKDFFGSNSNRDALGQKKRFYLVFRGLDTLIKIDNDNKNNKLTELFTTNCIAQKHEIYCYLYYMLNEQLKLKKDRDWQLFVNESDIKPLTDIDYKEIFVGFDSNRPYSSTGGSNNSSENCGNIFDDTNVTIWKEFDNKIHSFNQIKKKNEVTENYRRIVPLFPHIYFTGYPITNSLIIAKNSGRGQFAPEITANQSLRLGVNELVIDMLYGNLPKFTYYDGTYPHLMSYMFGRYTG